MRAGYVFLRRLWFLRRGNNFNLKNIRSFLRIDIPNCCDVAIILGDAEPEFFCDGFLSIVLLPTTNLRRKALRN